MTNLYLPSAFIRQDCPIAAATPSYWYEGRCPQTGALLRLPRTALVEEIAQGLMQHLALTRPTAAEGKMYGVLLVATATGEQRVLKAFSGLLNGQSIVAGWVPPLPGRDQVALEESRTLVSLDTLKQELIALQQLPERQQYEALSQAFAQRLQQLKLRTDQSKQERQQQRQRLVDSNAIEVHSVTLEQLDQQSRQDGIDRRNLKRERNVALQPLKLQIERADARMRELKQQRKQLSRQLQAQLYASYRLTNFAGQSLPLEQLMIGGGLPTGTGECCTPKLLHYAATHQLTPLAMAEFWWGASATEKRQGEFYGACVDRCQPLLGFLLSGLSSQNASEHRDPSPRGISAAAGQKERLTILYEDEWLIAVDKPAGLLTVPGRDRDSQDSVLSRLQQDGIALAVHRLDQDTSGILLLARDAETHRQLNRQFHDRQVHKVYEAVLAGTIEIEQGVIDLPLWSDPDNRPYQKVDRQRGKPSVTQFRSLSRQSGCTRVEFLPVTGRTHQLRVHAVAGLGIPILGDRLYGKCPTIDHLHLHARELQLMHPRSGQLLHLQTATPF